MAKFKALYSEKDFVEKLVTLISSLTIKYEELAYQNETTDSHTAATRYLAAIDEWDNFNDYSYSEQELIDVGFTPAMAGFEAALVDKDKIPEEFREQLLINKRAIAISEYTELNEYYRVLNGLPPLGNEYYYYKPLSKYVSAMTDKEINTYRDELVTISKTDLVNLKYLRYLGEYKIDLYKARKADNFEILQYDTLQFETEVLRKFLDFYDQSRAYIWNVYYNKGFMDYPYYENFIALIIAFDTMQKFIAYQITLGIKRDFFDKESIKNILVSFGIPYIEEIPTTYQIRLIKNMNQILQNKGTNKVLFDLCDLFSYGDVSLYKYYLVKDFKAYNAIGPIIDLTQDNKDIYDLHFQKVPIDAKNLSNYLTDKEYRMEYEHVIEDDPFWGENIPGLENDLTTLKNEIKEKEFNYLCTKYLSLDILIDLSSLMYKTVYFFNLINTMNSQNRDLMSKLYFYSGKIKSSSQKTMLWDSILALYYLLYHRFGYSANLQYRPEAVGMIYGFNFDDANLTKINSAIDKYLNRFKKPEFKKKYGAILTLPTSALATPNKLVETFSIYMDQLDLLRNALIHTTDKDEYMALKEIVEIISTTSSVRNVFSNKNYTQVLNEIPILLDGDNLIFQTIKGGIVNSEDKPVRVFYNGTEISSNSFEVDQLANTITISIPIADSSLVRISYYYLEIDFTYSNLHDYLQENDSELLEYCDYYINLDNEYSQTENISTAITTLIDLIEQYINMDELNKVFSYLNMSYNYSFRTYLLKMLNTFKAYTVDIHSISTIFLLQDRAGKSLRLIDEFIMWSKAHPVECLKSKLIEYIVSTTITITPKNDLFYEKFIEEVFKTIHRIIENEYDFKETLTLFLGFAYANHISLNEQIKDLLKNLDLESSIDIRELYTLFSQKINLEGLTYEEILKKITDKSLYSSLVGLINDELINEIEMVLDSSIDTKELAAIFSQELNLDKLNYNETLKKMLDKSLYSSLVDSINEELISEIEMILGLGENRNILKFLIAFSYFSEFVKESTLSLITISLFEECQLDSNFSIRIPFIDTLEINYE